jgi:hypothetical protein
MEVDERPTETYTDIGGLGKQIEELVEAVALPVEQANKFKTLEIKPPKGCFSLYPFLVIGVCCSNSSCSSPRIGPLTGPLDVKVVQIQNM